MSYGGALLTTLVNAQRVPKNVELILYAPAFYITLNTAFNRLELQLYGSWRKYCDYKILGCGQPNYSSGDETAKPMFDKQKSPPYLIMPALIELFEFDTDNRDKLATIKRPFSLIIAKDDNRVSYTEQKAICERNPPYCHLYTFPSGKHLIHWGAQKKQFEDLLVKLANQKISQN